MERRRVLCFHILMIEPQDEWTHPIGAGRHWQESWYFNWADERSGQFGIARIGLRFHENEIDGLIVTIRDGKPEFAYPALNVRPDRPWGAIDPAAGVRARNLCFRMEEPLKRWRLTLEGSNTMDLLWEAFTPAFDYRDSVGHGPKEIASAHFEQSGRVTGTTCFKGRQIDIDGFGQRDKSWGVRDWASIEGWDWISVQFGDDLSFNAWTAPSRGQRYLGGFIHYGGANRALTAIDIDYRWGDRPHEPAAVTLRLTDETGRIHRIDGSSIGLFPLAKKGLWVYEALARFSMEHEGRTRTGLGVIEHTFHVGHLGYAVRAGEIARVAGHLLRR